MRPIRFFLPHENELAALRIGDLVKITFEWDPAVLEYEAERMWVTILQIGSDVWMGTLENEPSEKNRAQIGDAVSFHRHDILDYQFADPVPDVQVPDHREYWERCRVDSCVLDGSEPVEFIYREEPHMKSAGEKYPDSGWRIRCREHEGDDMDGRESQHVAIGAVLNKDDSWLPLIDSPVGSAFKRDFTTGAYLPQS